MMSLCGLKRIKPIRYKFFMKLLYWRRLLFEVLLVLYFDIRVFHIDSKPYKTIRLTQSTGIENQNRRNLFFRTFIMVMVNKSFVADYNGQNNHGQNNHGQNNHGQNNHVLDNHECLVMKIDQNLCIVDEKQIGEENNKIEETKKFEGILLKVQNIDIDINNDVLNEIFSKFGTVLNAKIISAEARGRRHAIVSYSSPLEAATAVHHLNEKVIYKNKLHVTLHTERKRTRRLSTPSLQKLGQMAFTCQKYQSSSGGQSDIYLNPKIPCPWGDGSMKKSKSTQDVQNFSEYSFAHVERDSRRTYSVE